MRSVVLDVDGPVHVADFGGSGPAMVLVHGLGGSHVNWIAVGPALAGRFRVVAPDLIGFGRTPRHGRSTTLASNRALLSRLVQAYAAGGPAIVVGNSMGGLLGCLLAASEPERVAGLVLIDAALPRTRQAGFGRGVAASFLVSGAPWLGRAAVARRVAALGPDRLVRETLAQWCIADMARVPDSVVAAHVAIARERFGQADASASFAEAARSVVLTLAPAGRAQRMLARIHCPTLVVHGRHDRLVPVGLARSTADRHHWPVEVLDAGHTPQIETPAEVVAAMTRWLDGPGARALERAGGRPPAAA